MSVELPQIPSDRHPWVNPNGTPSQQLIQFMKLQELKIKQLETRIAALESP
jgi:hypothetical protein